MARERRQRVDAESKQSGFGRLTFGARLQPIENIGELPAEEDGHDGRRCFGGAQPVVVPCRRNRRAEQILMPVHGTEHGGAEEQKDDVLVRGVDRKSTRLNSSHVASSYAVFCLKKKNSRATI